MNNILKANELNETVEIIDFQIDFNLIRFTFNSMWHEINQYRRMKMFIR